MKTEANKTAFRFGGVRYTSLVDYCEKQYLDRIEVLSFQKEGDVLLQVIERHHDFYLRADIEFCGIVFDSLDHLFFALSIKHTNYIELLNKDNWKLLLPQLTALYKSKGLRPLVIGGKKYLTYQEATFALGLPEKRIMLKATCDEQELFLSDSCSELEYIKEVKRNCKLEGKRFNPKSYKLPSASKYVSLDGKPAVITKTSLRNSRKASNTANSIVTTPKYSFVTDEPIVIRNSKSVVRKTTKATESSKTRKSSFVGGIKVRGIPYKNISRALTALNLRQSHFYSVVKLGFSEEDTFELLLLNVEIGKQFPLDIKGKRYSRPSTAVVNNNLTLEEYYRTVLIYGVMPFTDLLCTTYASKYGQVLEVASTETKTNQKKLFTSEQLESLKTKKYSLKEATRLRKLGHNFDDVLVILSTYISYRNRRYKSISSLADALHLTESLLEKYYSETGDVTYSVKTVREDMFRLRQEKKLVDKRKKREAKIKFTLFGKGYTSRLTAANNLGVTLNWLNKQLNSGMTEKEIEDLFYPFQGSFYISLAPISNQLGVDKKFLSELINRLGYQQAIDLLTTEKDTENQKFDKKFFLQLVKHVGHRKALSILASDFSESA